MTALLLVLAAAPAMVASLLLMDIAGTSRHLITQQAVVAVVGAAILLVGVRIGKRSPTRPWSSLHWPLLAIAACLLATLSFGEPGSPHRWFDVGNVRLYVAAIVLPAFLLIWHRADVDPTSLRRTCTLAMLVVAVALLLQPDAAQLTALSVGALPILAMSTLRLPYKIALATALVVALAVCWAVPDPLSPVSHVEGIFGVARTHSVRMLLLSVLAAALPVLAFAWLARSRASAGLLAVAAYYATLFSLAPLQITPVPLLGFGASPILGYFIASALAQRFRSPGGAPSSALGNLRVPTP